MNQWDKSERLRFELKQVQEHKNSVAHAGTKLSLSKEFEQKMSELQKEQEKRASLYLRLVNQLILVETLFETGEARAAVKEFREWYESVRRKNLPIKVAPDESVVLQRTRLMTALGTEVGQSIR